MDNQDQPEYEYHAEIRPEGIGLTKEEIEQKGREGWEEYFPTPEEQITFTPTSSEVLSGISHKWIFRRLKK